MLHKVINAGGHVRLNCPVRNFGEIVRGNVHGGNVLPIESSVEAGLTNGILFKSVSWFGNAILCLLQTELMTNLLTRSSMKEFYPK